MVSDVKEFQPATPNTNEASYHMDSQQNGPNSWIACSKTLHSLLEQYLKENGTLSSFKQVLEKNSLQEKYHGGEAQDHVTSHEPPPLLHCPTKRSLEQNHVTVGSPDPKCSRSENYCAFSEQNPVRMRNETYNAREEMFEKTRTLGNSLKPLGPPPPLLKQPPVYKHEREIRWGSLQKHYTKDNTPDPAVDWKTLRNNEGCKHSTVPSLGNVSRNARIPGNQFQRTELSEAKPVSPSSIGKQKLFAAEPVPRQIESPDNSSCGGYAFDHMAMPKIVAVHSVSRGSQDEDEWAKNKAFISRAKANQNKPLHSRASVKERGMSHSQTRAQNQQAFTRHHPRYQETNQSAFGNMTGSSSEEVTFERYVLYHLLSKFQGNVEQVKRVLKQNLMQEWLAYSQGNVDPSQQTFEGVNFYELRKLYEIWCQLQKRQRTNAARSSTLQTVSNIQNPKSNRVDSDFRTNIQQNPEVYYRNNQSVPNCQRPRSASCSQGNSPLHNGCSTPQGIDRSSVNPCRATPNSQHNDIVRGPTRGGSNKDIPIPVQEKIFTFTQNSGRGANRTNPYPASVVYHNQHDINASHGNIHAQSCNVKRKSDDQVKPNDVFLTQHAHENVPRNQYETYGDPPQRKVLKQDEKMTTTNISLASLLQHFPQTISKPSPNQSLPSVNSPLSPSNSVLRGSSVKPHNESGQCRRHPMENAVRSESQEKDAVYGQETKASYLWRFKGGKLISDNMPSINRGERLTEIELDDLVSSQQKNAEVEVSMETKREVHTIGQQSYHKVSASISLHANEQGCNTQKSQRSSLAVDQQHKKVCGAAASGQRCYCVLDHKGCPQSTKKSNDPIQSMQRMINRTSRNSPTGKNTSPIQSQISNIKIKTERSISSTHNVPVYQPSDTRVLVSPQTNNHSSVPMSQGGKKTDATLDAQGNQESCSSPHVSPFAAQISQRSNAIFYASRNAQANQQTNDSVTIVPNPQANQHSSRVSPTPQIEQHSHPSFHVSHNERETHLSNTSRNAQLLQQYNTSLHVSRNSEKNQQCNGNFHAQTNQQSNSSFHVSINALVTQQPNANSSNSQQSDVSSNTQENQHQSNTSFNLPGTAQVYQQSNGSSKASRNSPSSQSSNAKPEISEVSKTVPKVEKNLQSCQKENRKNEASNAIKSEKTNDKNCSFLTSLPPKKQYTSLHQLAKKIIETRQRFEMESIPWKKKILKSLEGVLMKRLRKIEKETGEQADLGGRKGFETEASTTEQKTKK